MNVIFDPARDLLLTIAHWLPQLLGALLVLLIGYIIAKAVEGIVKRLLSHTKFDSLLKKGTAGSYIERIVASPSNLVGSVVFWLLWLGALSIGVTILGIPALTNFINSVYSYVPNVLAALLIFLVAGAVSTAVAAVVTRVMGETPTGKLVATVVPVVTMLIATFMILNQLQIAPEIVTITYAALTGAAALALALAFGLGGRDVAARLLEQAYTSGREQADGVKADIKHGRDKAAHEVGQAKDRI